MDNSNGCTKEIYDRNRYGNLSFSGDRGKRSRQFSKDIKQVLDV